MYKRISSLLLALIMVIGMLPMSVFATEVDDGTAVTEVTEPAPTETEPAPTETEPVPTETEPTSTEDPLAEVKATLEAMIAALPTPEEVEAMNAAEREAFHNEKLAPIYVLAMENGINIDGDMTLAAINDALNSPLPIPETPGVASVNGTSYGSLAAAVTAAEAGQTITLLADIEITEETTFTMADGTILNLNGKTIKGDDGKAIFTGTNFTIKNGTVTGFNGTDYYPITIDGGSATLEGLTFENGGVKIKGGATVTLKDNTITANQSKFKYAVWAFEKSKVTIESGTYFGGKNGYDVFAEDGAKFVANGGTYKFKIVERNIENEELAAVENADGTYSVEKFVGVASVNGKQYKTLQAAIDAANTGDTVALLADITEQIVINKSLTLDLGDFTITGNTAEAVVRAYSDVADATINVTINATTGGIVNTGNGYAIYAGEDLAGGNDQEKTNLTIKGGNYASAGTDCVKQIMGLCTINGGSYKSSYGRTVLNGERWYNSEFAINGGKFYEFNPACVSVWTGGNDGTLYHHHDIIAAGKTAEYTDGWYTVVDGEYTPVAEMKSLCYPSVEAALKASIELNDVANLGTINLKADDTLNLGGATITLPKGLVIDLNGHTLTVPFQQAMFAGENITIKNGTITTGSTENYGLYIVGGSFTIENVTCTNGINVQAGTVTLKDVNATCPNKYYAVYAGAEADVTILSGTYKTVRNAKNLYAEGKITVYGGTFSKDPSAFVAEGYTAVKRGSNYVVTKGITTYEQLVAAIAAAKDGDTIKIDGNITAPEAVVINKSLTLDLGEYTITGNTDGAVVRAYSDVADATINVTINAANGGIVNEGTGYAIYAGEDLAGGNDKEKTNLTINGGNYESAGTDCIKQIMGLCTINGGSYKSSYGRTVLNGQRYYNSEFAINGGTFYEFNPACVSVWTGGNNGTLYHHHDIIAEGKTAEYKDGWYTVVEGEYTPVAKTKSLCYPSIEAALKASINLNDVANLGTITLLADDTLDLGGDTITLPKGLVIDLNGNTLTVPFQQAMFAGEKITIKNGTITTGSTENYGLYIMGGSFTVENVTCTNGINVQAGTVTLKDVNATCPNKYYAVYAGADADVTILSGNYKTVRNAKNLYADGKITAYGGTYNKKPDAKYIADGYVAVKDGSNYIVREGSLQEIIDAAEAGATVTLTKNYNVTETITIDKNLTLDLGKFTITSTAKVGVYANGGNLTINGTTGGIVVAGTVAVGQDNGICTINGGSFRADGDTHDVANGKPVKYRYTLDNSNTTQDGITGSFVINGGKFYGFNPACMFINPDDGHDHDSIAADKVGVLDENGWFTVAEGTLTHTIVCDCNAPAPSHQYCFTSEEQANLFMTLFTNCKFDKIVEITAE